MCCYFSLPNSRFNDFTLGSLKLAMVGVFTPQNSVNATCQGLVFLDCPLLSIYHHTSVCNTTQGAPLSRLPWFPSHLHTHKHTVITMPLLYTLCATLQHFPYSISVVNLIKVRYCFIHLCITNASHIVRAQLMLVE